MQMEIKASKINEFLDRIRKFAVTLEERDNFLNDIISDLLDLSLKLNDKIEFSKTDDYTDEYHEKMIDFKKSLDEFLKVIEPLNSLKLEGIEDRLNFIKNYIESQYGNFQNVDVEKFKNTIILFVNSIKINTTIVDEKKLQNKYVGIFIEKIRDFFEFVLHHNNQTLSEYPLLKEIIDSEVDDLIILHDIKEYRNEFDLIFNVSNHLMFVLDAENTAFENEVPQSIIKTMMSNLEGFNTEQYIIDEEPILKTYYSIIADNEEQFLLRFKTSMSNTLKKIKYYLLSGGDDDFSIKKLTDYMAVTLSANTISEVFDRYKDFVKTFENFDVEGGKFTLINFSDGMYDYEDDDFTNNNVDSKGQKFHKRMQSLGRVEEFLENGDDFDLERLNLKKYMSKFYTITSRLFEKKQYISGLDNTLEDDSDYENTHKEIEVLDKEMLDLSKQVQKDLFFEKEGTKESDLIKDGELQLDLLKPFLKKILEILTDGTYENISYDSSLNPDSSPLYLNFSLKLLEKTSGMTVEMVFTTKWWKFFIETIAPHHEYKAKVALKMLKMFKGIKHVKSLDEPVNTK